MEISNVQVILNKYQSRLIAFCILNEISDYVSQHKIEFEDFLKAEETKEKEKYKEKGEAKK